MKLDEMQELWNSRGNHPTPGQCDRLINQFALRLRRRRRQEVAWLVWTFFVLTLLTGLAGWLVFGTDKIRLAAEWAVIPLLLVPWGFAFLFLRKLRRSARVAPRGDMTISESLTAALAGNEAERAKLRTVGLMYLITLPILAVCLWQLHSVGKVSSRELVSMVTFLGTALALSAGALLARYWFGVLPEGAKLKTLLRQFEQGA